MITKENFKELLEYLNFKENNNIYIKNFDNLNCELKVDFENEKLIFPNSLIIHNKATTNFSSPENFVVFECVDKLLTQGYSPKHIELEPTWKLGHGASGGRADILIKDNSDKSLLIIECKTANREFNKAWEETQTKPTQLFSYAQQEKNTKFIALYTSDFTNNRLIANYYLINLSDNKELIENNSSLKPYKDATTVEEIYKVWCETYDKEYATVGIFEDNRAYEIGKTKFNIDDLKTISSKDIQGKYHEFATILRVYNVSGRENAFDKLVNLFLCKVVDEIENPNELKFYWKGKAYDDPYEFQDRLQQLYKNGMKKFLNEDITYNDNSTIEAIFKLYDLETIKKDVKNVLKEQKFFTNNDFAFSDVHNEKLFYQNFEVLLKVAKMMQDIKLTECEENQFLGDMFEGFLDQGIKQSEGQFFTPMPIVKFIINSLPKREKPKVIDYACGAGHFLNEYASLNRDSQIVGVEKEYRLSKVAKVSSFMYGSEIDIIHSDALKESNRVKNGSFDILVANPPYSVKGFLQTLNDEERKKYELIDSVDEKSYSTNNSIECFFIERAKSLLAKDGLVAIIVPSSILNKGSHSISSNKKNTYVNTREIILKYFEIVSICEFGSGTFGKTGTNTVTLFLKRRCNYENFVENFKELADSIFIENRDISKTFKDKYLLQKYCKYIEVDFTIYKTLVDENLDEAIFEIESFKEYREKFEKLTETKNRKKKKQYKELSKDEQIELEQKKLIQFIKTVEQDKFYYFALAYQNSSDVVIVKSPTKNSEIKRFLGYEWSSAKGNEGIKYLASANIEIDDDLEEDDKRVLENIQGLNSINTPLYNSNDSDDESKINKIIKDSFDGIKKEIREELKPFVSYSKLIDMLDFSRVDFNKAISLTPNKKVEIESKWDLVKLGDLCKLQAGSTPSRQNDSYWKNGNIKWLKINDFVDFQEITNTKEKITTKALNETGVKLLPKNTVVITIFATIGRIGILKENMTTNQAIVGLLIKDKNKIINYYLMYTIKYYIEFLLNQAYGTAQLNINSTKLSNLKIPLPPLEIQEQIIKECEKIDSEVEKANEVIKNKTEQIEKILNNIYVNEKHFKEIDKISESIQYGLSEKMNENKKGFKIFRMNEIINRYMKDNGKMKFSNISKTEFSKFKLNNGDILFNRTNSIEHVGKTGIFNLIGDYCFASYLIRIVPNRKLIIPFFLVLIMNSKQFLKEARDKASKSINQANINATIMKNIKIPLPSIEFQNEIVTKIEKLENQIDEAKKVVDEAKERKEEILRKYL